MIKNISIRQRCQVVKSVVIAIDMVTVQKSTRAILFRRWQRHFSALSPAWRSWRAIFNFRILNLYKTKKPK